MFFRKKKKQVLVDRFDYGMSFYDKKVLENLMQWPRFVYLSDEGLDIFTKVKEIADSELFQDAELELREQVWLLLRGDKLDINVPSEAWFPESVNSFSERFKAELLRITETHDEQPIKIYCHLLIASLDILKKYCS